MGLQRPFTKGKIAAAKTICCTTVDENMVNLIGPIILLEKEFPENKALLWADSWGDKRKSDITGNITVSAVTGR